MPIEPGTKLGHYEIVAPIGAGGMGEVYRARDTRLDRTVAVKVLPQHLSENTELRQRFEQEARAVSSLNHPNICTLHDIGCENGVDFMVMEYIEGETLSDRLRKGPLPLDEALRTACAVGDALDKAHRKGITHRDVKPGNVMLTQSGPKLLDFGLAKFQSRPGREPDLSAVTEQKPLTEKGAILGTFQYMAPEQLEGGDTDARTDIFAFGVLLYEMVTGHKAFSGNSQASLISAIMSSEPRPISELRPATPKSIDRIVRRCLAKDPEDRWQSARDVVLELASIEEDGDAAEAVRPTPSTRERLAWAVLALGAAAIAGIWASTNTSSQVEVTRLVLPLLPGDQLLGDSVALGSSSSVDISPDGRVITYAARGGDDSHLYLRRLDTFEAVQVPGTEGARAPFFSPDGQWVGFRAQSQVRKAAVEGAATIKIMDLPVGFFTGASWANDGTIVFAGPILTRVSDGGGDRPTPIAAEGVFVAPQILPGGQNVLVNVTGPTERVVVVSMESGSVRTLLEGYGGAKYVSSGHLIVRDIETDALLAVAFDLDSLEVRGTPVPVVDGVYMSPRSGTPHFAVSPTGVLVYVPAASVGTTLVWVDRQGNVIEPLEGVGGGTHSHPRLSPDGRRVAVDMFLQASRNVWVYDLTRGTRTRLTSNDAGSYSGLPVWTPDGVRVSFYSIDRLYSRVADASSEPELLIVETKRGRYPISWSPDGTTLAFAENQPAGDRDIYTLHIGGEPQPFLSTSFNERSPMFSPDGHFIAYVSNQSGRDEVYVRTYPKGDEMSLVSTDGGTAPVWSRDGRELFYRNGSKMMLVPVELSATFRSERPSLLFEAQFALDGAGHPAYDVSPDGQRFLMIQESQAERTQLNVVFNWFDELERLVPSE